MSELFCISRSSLLLGDDLRADRRDIILVDGWGVGGCACLRCGAECLGLGCCNTGGGGGCGSGWSDACEEIFGTAS